MKILRSVLLLSLLNSSLCGASPIAEVDETETWGEWINKVASGVSMTVYNSPKLDGTVQGIEKFLSTSTDILIKLGLSGLRIENRLPGQCAPIIIVYVRGTSEAPNVGTIVGPPAFSTLRKATKDPKKVLVQGIKWGALLSTYQLGGDPEGIDDMVEQVNSAVKDCVKGTKDDSKIVMAGFSQGALMTRAAIKKLPIEVMNHVSAIILWGDPAKRTNPKAEQPVPLIDGTSIPGTGSKVHIVCHPLDAFCHNSDVTTPFHYSYFQWGRQDAVNFILQKTGFGISSKRSTISQVE